MGDESGKIRAATKVREFRAADAGAVAAIAEESPEAANWLKESYACFSMESGSLALVVETGGMLSGFLIARLAGDQAEILNLAVAAKHRRQGHGDALLASALCDFALQCAQCVYLEVRESNTGAIAFYESHGFSKNGRRKDYYRDPDEAALIMVKKLTV